jgi:hypothetical protein
MAGDRHDGGAGTEAEQGDADRQSHREHRAEREDQDDDRGQDAVDLALGHLELGEDVAAVLDGEPVDSDRLVAHVPDVLAERRRLLKGEVLDVELGVGDRAVFAGLTRLVVGAREVDGVERVDFSEQPVHRVDHRRVVDAGVGGEDDLRREAAERGVSRLQFVEDVGRLTIGQREVRAVVGAHAAGHTEQHDEESDPRPDHDPAMADGVSSQTFEHAARVEALDASCTRDRRVIGHL